MMKMEAGGGAGGPLAATAALLLTGGVVVRQESQWAEGRTHAATLLCLACTFYEFVLALGCLR